MIEEWKPIADLDGRYEVSNFGRVRNAETGFVRKLKMLPNGYIQLQCRYNGKKYYGYVHRIVADAFCNHPEGKNVINHLDNNIQNNRADNLEWVTQFENVHYGMKQKRYRYNAKPVIGTKDGQEFCFPSAHNAADRTGCDWSMIIKCCKGKYHMTHGYRWRYAEVIA